MVMHAIRMDRIKKNVIILFFNVVITGGSK